ncbi:MAG: hypothetical protein QW117_00155 [Candidatus Pacearchaeota archaeon]
MIKECIKRKNNRIKSFLKIGSSLALTLYIGGCIYKTKQLNYQLKPLIEKFEKIAKEGPSKTDIGEISYDGKLKEIIMERDEYIKSLGWGCHGGKWIVVPYDKGYAFKMENASVINPFIKIKSLDEFLEKYK